MQFRHLSAQRRGQIIAYSVVVLGLVVWGFPGLSSLYHLNAGAKLLDRFDEQAEPVAAQAAIAHLERAVKWDPHNSYAYRVLGKAYMAQAQPAKAALALSTFAQLRPEHPLGQRELASARSAVQFALSGMVYLDLNVQAPQATQSDPTMPLPHAFRPNDYVYTTTLDLYADGQTVPALFLHPVSAVTYTLTLTRPAFLRFGMGNVLYLSESGSDGITFEVWVNGSSLFAEHLTPALAQQGWQEREVDLGEFVGQEIALRLMTTPGPAGDLTADWAVWASPRIEAPKADFYRQALE